MGWFSSLVGGVVGFFIGGPVGAVIGAGIGATKVGEKVVNAVLDFVLQPFMPNLDYDPQNEAQRQQGVLIQRTGSVQQIPIVYGYRKVAGVVSYAETGATNNKYLYVAYVFSEGLVEGLREVYIDDWLLPVDQVGQLNAGQLVTVNSDRYKDRVQLRWYPGVYYSNPRSSTVGSTVKGDIFSEAPSFTSDMVYNGLAVLFARYEWKEIKTQEDADNNPFTGNIPDVKIAMLGKRVASLLVSAEDYSYDSAPVRYSTNPAEILLDYLRNPRYGKGLQNTDIDWTTWKRAARKCNQSVTYVASGISGPILTQNIVIDTSQPLLNNVKTMLQNFRAYMPYVQGKYKLRIEDAGNESDILSGSALIVQTLTKDDIISDITFNGIERSAKYNVVSVTYVDPDQKFSNQTVVYPESESERQVYINQDGGRENKLDITFGGITNYAIAKDMARLMFNKSRRQESCAFRATSKALELEPGDCVRIQSSILNFGEDPWRVITVKVNPDMTVDLGCVRNPDDIYPYTRVGEEDWVLPTYIPKGSIIYFPSSDNRIPLGLVPPTKAVVPPAVVPPPTNPPPTDPNAPGGGGVGGEGPIDEETDLPTDDSTVPPDNDVPEPPPPPPPFDAVLEIKSSQFNDFKNGTYSFSVIFAQPTAGLYSYSILWWRLNRYSPWQEVRLDTLPGAGGDIPWTLGPLPAGIYDFYVRSFATDGRASTRVLQAQLGSRYDLVELGRAGLLSSTVQTVTEGWTVPGQEIVTAPRYNDNIDLFELRPVLSTGAPTDPRTVKVRMQQITNTLSTPINTLISGVRVYYKLAADTYYNYEDYQFAANYLPGQIVEYTLTGDFGARVYPSDIFPNTASASNQTYDFIIRLIYADGTAAEKQIGPLRAPVEKQSGLYDFIIAGTDSYSAAKGTSKDIPAGFEIKTVDQDPNKDVAVGAEIVPGITAIAANRTTSKITFNFNAVANSRFRGFKIRWRPVELGSDPDYFEVTTGSVPNEFNLITYVLETPNYQHNQTYDWVITAQIKNNSGEIVDADNSLISRTKILVEDPQYNALYDKFNFRIKNSKEALQQLIDAFPAAPVINAKSWIKVMDTNLQQGGSFTTIPDVIKSGDSHYLNHWYELHFQMPDTATAIVCYRRVYSTTGLGRTASSSYSKYWDLGAWERVKISVDDLDTDSDGFYVARFRGPIAHTLFDPYYQVSSGRNLYSPTFYPKWPYGNVNGLTDIYPYAGAGNTYITSSVSKWNQYLFVIEDSGTELNKGLMLRDFRVTATSYIFPNRVDGFQSGNVSKDDVIDDLSVFNELDSGYDRRLDEALENIDLANLQFTDSTAGVNVPRKTPSTSATYNTFIVDPYSGVIVY